MARFFRKETIKCACGCNRLLNRYDSRNRERRFIHNHVRVQHNKQFKKGATPWNKKDGITKLQGYLVRSDNKRYIHIDGNKLNNDILNLMIISRAEHIKIHPACRNMNKRGIYYNRWNQTFERINSG